MAPLIRIHTFYCFTALENPAALKPPILACMKALSIRGTITLATEGINATISGEEAAMDAFMAFLHTQLAFTTPTLRTSYFDAQPFQRSKVKVKRELISLGVAADPRLCVGQYVLPRDWNALITAPDVVTIDTRNRYEFEMGHFTGAVNPDTRNFKETIAFTQSHLNPARTPRVAMYCTGGIRCEKYSSYLSTQGFTEVYHLHGGILAYLEHIPASDSLWQGSCFVFDERVALGHGLAVTAHSL